MRERQSGKKRGRPSQAANFTPEQLARIEKLAGMGFTDKEIGYIFEVSEQTINAWKRNPVFLEALKRGKAKADSNVAQRLYQKAMEGDVTAMIFWLKNRMPDRWSDRRQVGLDTTTEPLAIKIESIITDKRPDEDER